jgi:hypothetical protein
MTVSCKSDSKKYRFNHSLLNSDADEREGRKLLVSPPALAMELDAAAPVCFFRGYQ